MKKYSCMRRSHEIFSHIDHVKFSWSRQPLELSSMFSWIEKWVEGKQMKENGMEIWVFHYMVHSEKKIRKLEMHNLSKLGKKWERKRGVDGGWLICVSFTNTTDLLILPINLLVSTLHGFTSLHLFFFPSKHGKCN